MTRYPRRKPPPEERYRAIEDYALIGDGLTAALVSRAGSIDWCCFPRFDSPSVFARILDADGGGHWQIAPARLSSVQRSYISDSNVLVTSFRTQSGEADLIDFMPVTEASPDGGSSIVRIVRGHRGKVDLQVVFDPRFDYARGTAVWEVQEGRGVRALHGDESLTLYSDLALHTVANGAEGEAIVAAGEEVAFVLTYRSPPPRTWHADVPKRATQALDQTVAFWRSWMGPCTYQGPYREMVRRSALVLKLLDYRPTGAIVAAPTTSLPEKIGGVRNWDYRYCWLRDTAFTLYALYHLGFVREGELFFDWILELAAREPASLQVLYGVHGEKQIEEEELHHLEGYRGSHPVRLGNAAYKQKQLDIYGEVLDCAFLIHKYGSPISQELWSFLRALVDHVTRIWKDPDEGIWEVRSGPQQFVYSKALCWVAVDRGIKLGRSLGFPAEFEGWQTTREEIMRVLLREGYNENLGAFTQTLNSNNLDASALALVLRNVLPVNDRRMRSTVERIARDLNDHGLLHRYSEATDDGLPPGEGVFLMCSFWLADCYAEMGRLKPAQQLFERLLGYANHLGLYSEELDPATGHMLGNFPQAFTHVALINAAITLQRAQARGVRQRKERVR